MTEYVVQYLLRYTVHREAVGGGGKAEPTLLQLR